MLISTIVEKRTPGSVPAKSQIPSVFKDLLGRAAAGIKGLDLCRDGLPAP